MQCLVYTFALATPLLIRYHCLIYSTLTVWMIECHEPLLNQCKYLSYPVQSVIVLISRKRRGANIQKVKISVDLKKPITGHALRNDGTLEQRISFAVVGKCRSLVFKLHM